MWYQQLYRFFLDAVRPPFRNTPWLVLLYVLVAVVYNPNSHFNKWILTDTDDYMRFLQVFNWLDGHGWRDLLVERLNPQYPMVMHWARLVDIPLALMLLALQALAHFFQWEAQRTGLAMLTAFLLPSFLLTGILFMLRAQARPLIGKGYAALACFFLPLSSQLLFQFMPMRVDHHAYIILCAGVAFVCLQRMALNLHPLRHAAFAGIVFTLGLWNGAEILPMLIGFGLCLTLLMIMDGWRTFLRGPVFAFTLLFSSATLLYFTRPAAALYTADYDAFSIFYVMVAACAAVFYLVLFLVAQILSLKNTPYTHGSHILLLALSVFLGLLGLHALLQAFPDFIAGPYARVNPLLHEVFFPNIREAIPFIQNWKDLRDSFGSAPNQAISGAIFFALTRLFFPTLAVLACFFHINLPHSSGRRKKLWAMYALFVTVFTLLCLFWQLRVITYAQMFSIPPVVAMMLYALRNLKPHYQGRVLFGWEITTVLTFTILPLIIIPSTINGAKFNPDMLFFVSQAGDMPCKDRTKVVTFLNEQEKQDKKPSIIMAPMDYTPELLFYTNHSYISAPYHRNAQGIADMVFFFRSKKDDAPARTIAERLALDYVLVCKATPFQQTLERAPESKNMRVTITPDKIENAPTQADIDAGSLAFRLINNKVPTWLERTPMPMETDFMLFRVLKDRLKAPSRYEDTAKAKTG